MDISAFRHNLHACEDIPGLPAHVTAMQKNMLINLHPPRPPLLDLDAGKGDLFHPAVSSGSPLLLPESTRGSFADAQTYVAHAESEETCGGDVTISPLGTNSAMPSKYRNGKSQRRPSVRSTSRLSIFSFCNAYPHP